MFMRPGLRRGPGLLGAVARTAVVAGTATAVSRGINRSLDNREQERAEAAAYEQAAAQQQAPAPQQPPGQQDDLMAQLQRLADLRQQGLLDDQEFAAAKAKLLAS
jgi:hypothetical protein